MVALKLEHKTRIKDVAPAIQLPEGLPPAVTPPLLMLLLLFNLVSVLVVVVVNINLILIIIILCLPFICVVVCLHLVSPAGLHKAPILRF